jgi:hypothetical protein
MEGEWWGGDGLLAPSKSMLSMKSMVELIEMVFERTWPGGDSGPQLRGLRTAGPPTTPHALNIVVGLLRRPTSAAPAHPRASHRPTRPSLPTPHRRGLKHRDYARHASQIFHF